MTCATTQGSRVSERLVPTLGIWNHFSWPLRAFSRAIKKVDFARAYATCIAQAHGGPVPGIVYVNHADQTNLPGMVAQLNAKQMTANPPILLWEGGPTSPFLSLATVEKEFAT